MDVIDRTREPRRRATVDARDIVVSGCGRVYVYPPDLEQADRFAGMNHFPFRVGYIERSLGMWVSRDFGNRVIRDSVSSRSEAVGYVVRGAGWAINGRLPSGRLSPTRVAVDMKQHSRTVTGRLLVSDDGQVFVTRRDRLPADSDDNLEPLGFIWRSGNQIAAITLSEESPMRTLHRSSADAVKRLARAVGH